MILKLQHYSALAVAFLAGKIESDAQVTYTDIKDDTLSKINPEYLIDLNNDGIVDFKIRFEHTSLYVSNSVAFFTDSMLVTPYGNNSVAAFSNEAIAFPCGDTIDDRLNWKSKKQLMGLYGVSWVCASGGAHSCSTFVAKVRSSGEWLNQQDHYLGLKLVENGNTYYGWARLDLNIIDPYANGMQCIIKDFAVQKNANEASVTAKIDCADLKAVIPHGPYIVCAPECANFQLNLPSCYLFQWYKNDSVIPGATNNLFSVCDSMAYVATYYAVVNDLSGCTATSNKVTMTRLPFLKTPVISRDGDTLMSTISDLYQWYVEGAAIAGATQEKYVPEENGSYQVLVTDSDGCSSISDSFDFADCKLYKKAIHVTSEGFSMPDSVVTCEGVPVPVEIEAISQSYEWIMNDSIVLASGPGLTDISLHGAGKYYCNLIGWGDTCQTNSIYVVVIDTPMITQRVDTLISSSSGRNQWFHDGFAIAGATYQLYVATEEGSYFVEVTGDSYSCTLSSDTVQVTLTAIENIRDNFYPVISFVHSRMIQVRFFNSDFLQGKIKIVNALGQIIKEVSIDNNIIQIPFAENQTGWFVLDIEKDEHRFFSPAVIF